MRHEKQKLNTSAIKDAITPHDFYMREQNLSKYNNKSCLWVVAGLCPFHSDHKAGSFKINLKTGAYKCWSCGASGGDIIDFVQKRDHLDFFEALKSLTENWGVYCDY